VALYTDHYQHFFNCPDMIGKPGFHCGGNSEGLVDAAKVVVHVVNRHSVGMVLDFLAESIGQPSESPYSHAH
jgi:hypothetical protein